MGDLRWPRRRPWDARWGVLVERRGVEVWTPWRWVSAKVFVRDAFRPENRNVVIVVSSVRGPEDWRDDG